MPPISRISSMPPITLISLIHWLGRWASGTPGFSRFFPGIIGWKHRHKHQVGQLTCFFSTLDRWIRGAAFFRAILRVQPCYGVCAELGIGGDRRGPIQPFQSRPKIMTYNSYITNQPINWVLIHKNHEDVFLYAYPCVFSRTIGGLRIRAEQIRQAHPVLDCAGRMLRNPRTSTSFFRSFDDFSTAHS